MLKKIKNTKLFIFSLAACLILTGIWRFGYIAGANSQPEPTKGDYYDVADEIITDISDTNNNRFLRSADTIDFSGLKFTPWDVSAASSNITKRDKKPYTIMIYMNGSDLESEMGFATSDIMEMLKSGVVTDVVNIIIFTGGTNRWRNNVIPSDECVVWEIEDGILHKIADVGLLNMGDAGTLAGFIDFSMVNFPADKFGLIMWDHGGGSIAGFGHDEKFNHSYLTLLEMNYAFEKSTAAKNKLEFLGFDSCLMATVEMAVVASGYANFLVASQDIEPYDGWNYNFLSVLNGEPEINGEALGKTIVDSFMDYYRNSPYECLTLSVIDLSKADRVMGALGTLMKQCSYNMLTDSDVSFNTLATRRSGTKTFGVGSARDNECDMVDIGDMANKLSNLFPDETANILTELDNCVIYNRHNSDSDLKGLSAYYIYGGKTSGSRSLDMYASLNMNGDYTRYLNDFYGMLRGNDLAYLGRSAGLDSQNDNALLPDGAAGIELTLWQPVDGEPETFIMTGIQGCANTNLGEVMKVGANTLWPEINEKGVCLYRINSTGNSSLYAVPAAINGKDCDIIISFSESYPHGKILGARQEDGFIIQKGYDSISDGDKIAFYYPRRNNSETGSDWYKSEEFTVNGDLKLDWSAPRGKSYYSLLFTDIQLNEHFSELKQLEAAHM